MKILDRYIRRTVISTTLLVSLAFAAIQAFLALVQEFQYIGTNHYTLSKAFIFVPMQLPAQFYQLFPMVAFLGTMIGLGRLSSSSQLIVMRTSGVSIARIVWSVMKAAIIMIVVMTILGEGMGPVWQQKAENIHQTALYPSSSHGILKSIWLHHGSSFTHIGELKNDNTMSNVTRYQFGSDGQLQRATYAQSGQMVNGQWTLFNMKSTLFKGENTQSKTQYTDVLHIPFQPVLQVQMNMASAQQTLVDLYRTIHYRQSIGLGVNQFIFSFWQRLLQPFTSLVMIALAVPFVFGSFRSTSIAARIMIGVLFGFVFYILNQLLGPITLVYQFSPLWAAIIPTCFFCFVLLGCLVVMK